MVYDLGIIKRQRYIAPVTTATGGTVSSYIQKDTTYIVHAFTSSGILSVNTLTASLSAEYLIVAGGGGGGSVNAGGGGGGYAQTGTISLSPGSKYSIMVGAGGPGGASSSGINGNPGGNTMLTTSNDSSILFNGTTDSVTAPNSALFDMLALNYTIECWVYPTAVSAALVGLVTKYSTVQSWNIAFNAGGLWDVEVYYGGASALMVYNGAMPSLNNWHHVALVRNGANILFFVDGAQLASVAAQDMRTSTAAVCIGNFDGRAFYFPGYITNVRIVKGTAVYTGTFTVSTVALTSITNTVLLIAPTTTSTVAADITGGSTLTIAGTPTISAQSPFYTSLVLSRGGGYGGQGGTGAPGGSGGNGGGGGGQGSQAAGTGTQGFSGGAGLTVSGQNPGGGGGGTTSIGIAGVSGTAGAGGGGLTSYITNGSVSYGGGGGGGIQSGTPGAGNGGGGGGGGNAAGTAGTAFTGGGGGGGGGSGPGNGGAGGSGVVYIRYAATAPNLPYDAAFTSNTLVLSNQSTTTSFVTDASTNTALISIVGDVRPYTFNPFNDGYYSNYFNGTSGFQTAASSLTTIIGSSGLITSTFTIEAWIYHTARHGSLDGALVGDMSPAAGTNNWSWGPRNDGRLTFNWYTGSSSFCTGSSTIPLNSWTHILLSINLTSIKMYVNGIPETLSGTTTLTAPSSSLGYLGVGMWNSGASGNTNFTGYAYGLRILKGVIPTPVYVTTATTAQYLVVAGGGGGGVAGAGAGGLRTGTFDMSLGAPYTILVGAGGSGKAGGYQGAVPTNGSTSSFATIASAGGGYGAMEIYGIAMPSSGGSGGGGNGSPAGLGNTPATVPSQGNSGGTGSGSPVYGGGGGGGAGAIGGNGDLSVGGGAGGAGTYTTIISTTTAISLGIGQYVTATNAMYFAGGGGGGVFNAYTGGLGGIGGGGAAGHYNSGASYNGVNGTSYTGGGGGGSSASGGDWTQQAAGGNGGSGVILISHPNSVSTATVTGSPTIVNTGGNILYIFTASGTILFGPVKGLDVPTGPFAVTSSTTLLTSQSNRFADTSYIRSAITVSSTPQVTQVTPFTTSSIITVPSLYSTFFGTKTDSIQLPAVPNLITFAGDFTFECWVYPTDPTLINSWGLWDSRQSGATAAATVIGLTQLASPVTGSYRLTYYNGTSYYGTGVGFYNQWSHVAFVRVGSTLTFYINGVAGGTATISGTQTGAATTNPIYIGSKDNSLSGYGTVGYISNFRIVNGTAMYNTTTSFTPPTSALTATTATVLLTCQDSMLRDNSRYAYPLTPSGTIQIIPLTPFTQVYTAPTIITPNFYSTRFPGTTNYLTTPTSAAFNIGAGDFTIEGWWNFSVLPSGGVNCNLFGFYGGTNYNPYLYIWGDGTYMLRALQTSGDIATGVHGMVVNTWYHIAVVRSGNTYTIYKNGAVLGTGTSAAIVNENKNIIFGDGGSYLNGYMSNLRVVKGVAVYTGAFTPSTSPLTLTQSIGTNIVAITTQTSLLIAQSSSIIDASTNTFTITVTGAIQSVSTSPFTQTYSTTTSSGNISTVGSAYFDGTGDYLTATSTALGTGDFTIECWVYPNAIAEKGILQTSDTSGGLKTSYTTGVVVAINASGYWRFTVGGSNLDTTILAKAGTWTHLAVSRASSATKTFVNGVLATSGTVTDNLSGQYICIGSYYDTTYIWNGYISNVRIIKGQSLYISNFALPASPATAVTGTQLLTLLSSTPASNKSVFDYSPFGHRVAAGTTPTQGYFSPYGSNWSLSFGGSDYITTPSSFNTAMVGWAGSTWTVEVWVNVTVINSSNGGGGGIIGTYQAVAANGRWVLNYSGNGPFTFGLGYTITTGSQNNINTTATFPAGTWTHLAMTINATTASSSTIVLYINGVGQTFTAQDLSTHATNYSTIMIGGNLSQYVNGHNGYMSNLRMIKGAIAYTSNFVPPKMPFGLNNSGSLLMLMCALNRVADVSSTATYTVTGSPIVSRFSPFSNQGYNKSVIGGSMYTGGSDYLLVPDNPALNFGSSDFTVELWHYPTTTNPSANLISKRSSTAVYGGVNIGYAGSLAPTMVVTVNGTTWGINATSTVSCSVNSWNHLAFTRNGTTWRLFVNGVVGITQTLAGTVPTNSSAFTIAASAADGGTPFPTSYISDLRVIYGTALYTANFNTALPTAPLRAAANTVLLLNMADPAVPDVSMINNIITSVNARTATTTFKKYNSSLMYLDGASGTTLSVPASPALNLSSGDFTIEFWVYWTGTPSGVIIEKDGAYAVAFPQYEISVGGGKIGLTAGQGNQSSTAATGYSGVTTLVAATWYHVAIIRSGTTIKIFLNGNLESSTAQGQPMVDGGRPLLFGVTTGSPYTYNSFYLDDFRITKGVARYTVPFTPPTAPPKIR